MARGSIIAVCALAFALALVDVASARIPPTYRSCAALNRVYPHGVGLATARDRVTSGTPVTTFRRSTRLYRLAMSYNRGLDRDKDGVACERA
jgi:hypothetical protein